MFVFKNRLLKSDVMQLAQFATHIANLNPLLTQSNFHFPSDHFLYNFSLDNSNILFPLKVRVIGSQL